MAKLKRDEVLAQQISKILSEHKIDRVTGSDILEILYEKIAYDDLKQDANNLIDIELGGITDPKVLRQELYSLKEQSYERKIQELDKALLREGLGNFQYDYDLEKRRAVKTSHKTKRQTVSSEVYYNEKIRQISDLPYGSEVIGERLYVKPPDEVVKLRKQYEELYSQQYQIPKTTFKHEFVTLRQKIGIAIAQKGGVLDDIKKFDPSYDYRRIADKVGKLQNGTLSKEQKEFLDRQVRYLESDVTVLGSYEELAQQLGEDVKIPDKLSVRDKISEYRKRLGGRLQEIADNTDISKKSPAYLDLVDSQRQQNPELYRKTVEELSKEEGIGAWRAKQWSSGKNPVPLTAWSKKGSEILARDNEQRKRLFSNEITLAEFREAWKDPRNRRLASYRQVTKPDGSVITVPDNVTRFNGNVYRTEIDNLQLQEDFDSITAADQQRIQTARQKMSSLLEEQISQIKTAIDDTRSVEKDTSNLESLLAKKRERLVRLQQRSYNFDDIVSYDKRVSVIKSTADFLTAKADILEQDPFFDVNKILRSVKPEDRTSVLKEAKKQLTMTVKPAVDARKWQLEQRGLVSPSWISRQSLEKQLSWYRTADALISDIESKSYNDFSTVIADIDYGKLQRQLPVNYLQRVKGKVYRSTVDGDKVNFLVNRESRILSGPASVVRPSGQQNSFGKLLSQAATDQTLVNSATAVAQSPNFSEAYSSLSSAEKRVYDRNFGKPVKEGNTFYRSIYDMPDDVWARAEKAAGYDVPRQRGIPNIVSDINIVEEQSLQQKITEDLKNRTWEPVKEEEIPVQKPTVKDIVNPDIKPDVKLQEESKNNLKKMLQDTSGITKKNSISSMGLMGAFVLFNAAMTGSSREAEEHRRRVEEERRIKKYGYS